MRVITGSARGRRLETLPGEDITRPTAQAVKEAVFSMIQFEIDGSRVLDLFAGSAQLGIEAISRGAAECVFVDSSKKALQIIESNIKKCGFENQSKVFLSDARSFLGYKNVFDIAFLDPPYNSGLVESCLPVLCGSMSDSGIIICETSYAEEMPNDIGDFFADKIKTYGKTKITLYRKGNK